MPERLSFESWLAQSHEFAHHGHAVKYWDAGEGDVLLLMHGFPTASWDWHCIWNELSTHYRVIASDMIGFGFSAKPRSYTYSIFDQADLQEALCAHLGVGRVVILTHDYGNTVTQELLARYNERSAAEQSGLEIRKICYLNGGLFPELHNPLPIQRLLIGPLGGLVGRLMSKPRFEANLRSIFGPDTQPSQDELNQFWALIEVNHQRAITHKLARYQLERRQYRERWVGAMENAEVPQRFVVGMSDPISGANMAKRYRDLIPVSDVIEMPNIGHWPQIEAPKQIMNALREFMNRSIS